MVRGLADAEMLFNLDKCAVMHFGFANEGMEVRLGDKVLGAQNEGKGFGSYHAK